MQPKPAGSSQVQSIALCSWRVLLDAQALEAQATATLVQSLMESSAGQAGVLRGLQKALSEQPQLREGLRQLLQHQPSVD